MGHVLLLDACRTLAAMRHALLVALAASCLAASCLCSAGSIHVRYADRYSGDDDRPRRMYHRRRDDDEYYFRRHGDGDRFREDRGERDDYQRRRFETYKRTDRDRDREDDRYGSRDRYDDYRSYHSRPRYRDREDDGYGGSSSHYGDRYRRRRYDDRDDRDDSRRQYYHSRRYHSRDYSDRGDDRDGRGGDGGSRRFARPQRERGDDRDGDRGRGRDGADLGHSGGDHRPLPLDTSAPVKATAVSGADVAAAPAPAPAVPSGTMSSWTDDSANATAHEAAVEREDKMMMDQFGSPLRHPSQAKRPPLKDKQTPVKLPYDSSLIIDVNKLRKHNDRQSRAIPKDLDSSSSEDD